MGVGEFVGFPLLFFQPLSLSLSLSFSVGEPPAVSIISLFSLPADKPPQECSKCYNPVFLSPLFASSLHLSVLFLRLSAAHRGFGGGRLGFFFFSGGNSSKEQTCTHAHSGNLRCLCPDLGFNLLIHLHPHLLAVWCFTFI